MATFKWKNYIALQLLAFAFLIIVKPWQPNGDAMIHWDVSLYYAYLPATFIYHDVAIQKQWPVDFGKMQMGFERPYKERAVIKMSMGMAYLYSPFFFIAHGIALLNPEIEANGYSVPYQVTLGFAGVFWAITGVYFLFLFLCRFVSASAASIAVAIVFVGTNLFYYTFWEGAMSHGALFALLSITLWLGERYLEKQLLRQALVLGILAGLIVLIRPIMVLPLLALVVFYVYRLRGKINWVHIPVIIGFGLLIWLPQLAYWKYTTDTWFYYSYGGEGFFFNDPKIIKGLFGWRKGWLVYTPIMVLSILGAWPLLHHQKRWFWLIAPLFLANIYVIFSWWCWWYGGSYGMRPMIEFYPFLALPLAYFIQEFMAKRTWLRATVFSLIILLSAHNIFAIWQYKKSLLHWDSMTKEAYEAIFLQTNWPNNYDQLIDPPDYEAAKSGKRDL
jgi:hypothetical protein